MRSMLQAEWLAVKTKVVVHFGRCERGPNRCRRDASGASDRLKMPACAERVFTRAPAKGRIQE
jgi:hypothetical protein